MIIPRRVSLNSFKLAFGGLALLVMLGMGSFTYEHSQPGGPPPVEAGPAESGWVDGGTVVRLDDAKDRVGVGTARPGGKMEVSSSGSYPRPQLTLRQTSPKGDFARLRFETSQSPYHWDLATGHWGAGPSDFRIASEKSGNVMSLTSAGSVGIGTDDPKDRLEVYGGNIRVSGGSFIDDGTNLRVPDYVFESGYNLLPLKELEDYIGREGHLPNMPSADEIGSNGLDLSHFQMNLLEKVEELTLYILEQDKTIIDQQQQINHLIARFEAATH